MFGVDQAGWFAAAGQVLLPFVSDSLTLVSPILLLICSSILRNSVIQLVTGKQVTPVISVSVRH